MTAKRKCSTACIEGNPHRGYLCTCGACKGTQHGGTRIDERMIVELIDRRLTDPTVGKAEFARLNGVIETLLNARSIRRPRRRRAA